MTSNMLKRSVLGVEGLDEILEGGLPSNRTYLLQGDPGVGKTTLALQFLFEGLRQNESCMLISLAETRSELEQIVHSHGWSLDGIELFELSALEAQLELEAQSTLFRPSEVELNETTEILVKEIGRVKPQRLVFDSLSELRLLAHDPLRFRRQILAMKQFFAGFDSTVLLIDDRSAMRSELQVESIAHGVISLETLPLEYGAQRYRLLVQKIRGARFKGGYHDYRIERGGMRVFPRLVAAEHAATRDRTSVSSGLKGLDNLLQGGLDRGTATLIMGPSGTGKSTLTGHYLFSSALKGERSLYFTFDEGVETFLERSRVINPRFRDLVDSGMIRVKQIDPAEISPGEFAFIIKKAVFEDSVRMVAIDSLNGFLNAMTSDKLLHIKLHEILMFLNKRQIVSILTATQHGVIGGPSEFDVTYLADTVILLRYFEARGSVRQAISVIKKRSGGHERSLREFQITDEGLIVGDPLTEFRGVLTGVPQYFGAQEAMMEDNRA